MDSDIRVSLKMEQKVEKVFLNSQMVIIMREHSKMTYLKGMGYINIQTWMFIQVNSVKGVFMEMEGINTGEKGIVIIKVHGGMVRKKGMV